MKRGFICSNAVLLLLSSIAAYASGASAGQVTLAGSAGRETAKGYSMQVRYSLDSEVPLGDVLLIYAEPSHVLLLEHSFRPGVPGVAVPAKALVHGEGGDPGFSYDFRLPYDPNILGDTGMSVVLLANGRELLIAAGRLNASQFSFSTSFEVDQSTDSGLVAITRQQHCCGGGGRCGRMCIDCAGAYFTCDRIACTIECGWQ